MRSAHYFIINKINNVKHRIFCHFTGYMKELNYLVLLQIYRKEGARTLKRKHWVKYVDFDIESHNLI